MATSEYSSTRLFIRAGLQRFAAILILLVTAHIARAQATAGGSISGTIVDSSEATLSNVRIQVENLETNARQETRSAADGSFTVPFLARGTYKLTSEREGFRPTAVGPILIEIGSRIGVQVKMPVASTQESITVEASGLIEDSPAVGTVVNHQFVENLPLNGRSFQALITTVPGVTLTASGGSGAITPEGQFSVNGQRDNANYFTVDGVSANIGVNASEYLYGSGSGALPGLSATGGTNSLVSVDAMEEFRVVTSPVAPEYGRTPGGQISIATRAGGNQWHGSLFHYFRNDALDANDWFANRAGLRRPALRQNDFGGVLGGRIVRDRLFFFSSYEALQLRQPVSTVTTVPSLAARQFAPAGIKALLSAYPMPNGADLGNGTAKLASAFSNSSSLNAGSLRMDYYVSSRTRVFGRYNYAPSQSRQRGINGSALNTQGLIDARTETLTLGVSHQLSARLASDVRFNWSRSLGATQYVLDNFGGAVVPSDAVLYPGFPGTGGRQMNLGIRGLPSLISGDSSRNKLTQLNLVETFSAVMGRHSLQFGFDWRRVDPVPDYPGGSLYAQWPRFSAVGIPGAALEPGTALSGVATQISVSNGLGAALRFQNFSAYAQDIWRITDRWTLTYGLRWEVNPAVSGRNGAQVLTVDNLDQPKNLKLAPTGTPLYPTRFNNFAPRFGAVYRLSTRAGRETVVRGGIGTFYDMGFGPTGGVASGYPNYPYTLQYGVNYPLSPQDAARPVNQPGYITEMVVTDRNLRLPRTYHWNFSVEQSLGANQSFSATYAGAIGRKLLRNEYLLAPNEQFAALLVTRNSSTSDYHGLQLRYQRRFSRGFQALVSYSLAHSIDLSSNDAKWFNLGLDGYNPQQDRGSSDFDVRHAMTAALSWAVPAPRGGLSRILFGGFSADSLWTARSALPVDLVGGSAFLRFYADTRPDLVSGQMLYVSDANAPGGRVFNPAAFGFTPADADYGSALRQGTLGRNVLRGFTLTQIDLAVRRQFQLNESAVLQLRLEAFNLLNHANFANPDGSMFSGLFGTSTQVLGRGLGTGGPTSGLSPLYQVGGPRSMQLALRLSF